MEKSLWSVVQHVVQNADKKEPLPSARKDVLTAVTVRKERYYRRVFVFRTVNAPVYITDSHMIMEPVSKCLVVKHGKALVLFIINEFITAKAT